MFPDRLFARVATNTALLTINLTPKQEHHFDHGLRLDQHEAGTQEERPDHRGVVRAHRGVHADLRRESFAPAEAHWRTGVSPTLIVG